MPATRSRGACSPRSTSIKRRATRSCSRPARALERFLSGAKPHASREQRKRTEDDDRNKPERVSGARRATAAVVWRRLAGDVATSRVEPKPDVACQRTELVIDEHLGAEAILTG